MAVCRKNVFMLPVIQRLRVALRTESASCQPYTALREDLCPFSSMFTFWSNLSCLELLTSRTVLIYFVHILVQNFGGSTVVRYTVKVFWP